MSEDPGFFVSALREVLGGEPFASLAPKPALTMLGRTYASGFESDLEDWILRRPRRTVLNPAWPWAIWYPLRRSGAFARLSAQEQGSILREHGALGRVYGDADLAHDIRLACHGLDVNDNDFVIGLVGRDVHLLSHLVQTMRRTVQTSQYLRRWVRSSSAACAGTARCADPRGGSSAPGMCPGAARSWSSHDRLTVSRL